MAQADQVGVIGKGIVIRGNLTGGGNLVIEGRVEGQIARGHLALGGEGGGATVEQVNRLLRRSGDMGGTAPPGVPRRPD